MLKKSLIFNFREIKGGNLQLRTVFRIQDEKAGFYKRQKAAVYGNPTFGDEFFKEKPRDRDRWFYQLSERSSAPRQNGEVYHNCFHKEQKKISPKIFQHLSEVIIENFYISENDNLKFWNGLRILAVDDSIITPPNTAELKKCFGVAKNQSEVEVVQTRASVLYDVLNKVTLDATLENLDRGERELALTHSYR
jgi:hypothetical protein